MAICAERAILVDQGAQIDIGQYPQPIAIGQNAAQGFALCVAYGDGGKGFGHPSQANYRDVDQQVGVRAASVAAGRQCQGGVGRVQVFVHVGHAYIQRLAGKTPSAIAGLHGDFKLVVGTDVAWSFEVWRADPAQHTGAGIDGKGSVVSPAADAEADTVGCIGVAGSQCGHAGLVFCGA